MNRLLISACLLGEPVRYDGRAKPLHHPRLAALLESGRIVPFCPEVAGGLPVPRPAAEIVGGDGDAVIDGAARVETRDGAVPAARYRAGGADRIEPVLRQRTHLRRKFHPQRGRRQRRHRRPAAPAWYRGIQPAAARRGSQIARTR